VNPAYKAYSVSKVQDSTRSVIGDKEQRLLEIALQLETFTPRDFVEKGFAKDRKDAWWWINVVGIKRLKVIRRVAPGLYAVVRSAALKLLQRPVKRISEGIKRSRKLKTDGGSRRSMGTGSCVAVGVGFGGVLGYGGVWVDNGRYYDVWGGFRRQGRRGLWSLGVFDCAERVVYFEAAHVVTNLVFDGVVVVYTNVEDFERFGKPAARVEWRPPSGFVRRGGVSAVFRRSLEEFVGAFRALWVVLVENLGWRRVVELLRWLVFELRRRGFGGVLDGVCVG
jgi:hypothetical protein